MVLYMEKRMQDFDDVMNELSKWLKISFFFALWGSSELSMFCCNKEWPLQIYVDMFSIYLVLFISFKTIRAVNLSQILIWIQIHLNVDLNFDLEMNVDSYKDSGYLFILDLESDLYLDLVKIWIWILILEDLLTW